MGMQAIGRPQADLDVLRLAWACEQAASWRIELRPRFSDGRQVEDSLNAGIRDQLQLAVQQVRAELRGPLGLAQQVAEHERRRGLDAAHRGHREERRRLHLHRQDAFTPIVPHLLHRLAVRRVDRPGRPAPEG
jgi:hypothetical protein